jgi:hypothetical protein
VSDQEPREIVTPNPAPPKGLKTSAQRAIEKQKAKAWDANPANWRRFVQREGQGLEALPKRRMKRYPRVG